LGKSKGGQASSAGGGPSRTTIVIILVVLAFVVSFGALIWFDMRSSGNAGPPEGVQEFGEIPAGDHTPDPVDYEQNPPVGGPHNPVWQNSGFYGSPVQNETAVHTMEHGGVWITYSPDLPQDEKDAIREIVEGRDCLLASPYPDLPEGAQIVASSWNTQLRLDDVEDPRLDQFIQTYRRGTQTPEPGASCSGGTSETT
jgi:hypothetical protein